MGFDASHYTWVLEVRPGYQDEYKERYDEIWPEMFDASLTTGVRNYGVFRGGLTLLDYFETDDLKAARVALTNDPINANWEDRFLRS